AMAAGLTVLPDRLSDLRKFLCEKAAGFEHPPTEVDLQYACGAVTPSIVEALESLEPFGMKNPKPRIAVTGGWVRSAIVMKGKHLKLFVAGKDGETECLMWNGIGTPVGDALKESEGRWIDVYGTARIDAFG